MYKSPIEIVEDIQEKVTVSMENNVVRAVQAVGINIDKHELIAALTQDKSRYEAAYEQGKRDAVKHGRWIEIEDEIITGKCSVCGWDAIFAETDVVGMPYCPNCGAYMKGEEDEAY